MKKLLSKDKMSIAQKGKEQPKRKRQNPLDNNLPKHIIHYLDNKGNEGYRVEKDGRKKAFLSSGLTMEKKLKLAMDYLEGKTNQEINSKSYVRRTNENSIGLPKYMRYRKTSSSEGYCVVYLPLKTEKTFTSKLLSMEEKHDLAIKYLNEQITTHQLQIT